MGEERTSWDIADVINDIFKEEDREQILKSTAK